jgi:enolase-phosphatase E1
MKSFALQEPVRAILLDIEGTTTPIDFVYQTLFPYARARLAAYLERRAGEPDMQADLQLLRADHSKESAGGFEPPPYDDALALDQAVAYLEWLMDRDRKSTPLKSLQGKIWEEGFRSGEIRSVVFPDVPAAFTRWRAQSRRIAIYSSGSALAQRLLFAHTVEGDLSRYLDGYFDTSVGAKREADSYRRIGSELSVPPEQIVFLSDVDAELDAAHTAGMQTALLMRPGNPQQNPKDYSLCVENFDAIFP